MVSREKEYVLQNRWKLEGKSLIYFGIRKQPNVNKNRIKLKSKEVVFFENFLRGMYDEEDKIFIKFLRAGIVVPENGYLTTPKNLDEATYCKSCIANNYIIPGIEFDDDGLCPICADKDKPLNDSILPVKNTFDEIDKAYKKGRFDVALFYTGGKDSTYLLHYLSRELGLKVLALTLEIPSLSNNARQSIENAKRIFKNAEFVSRSIAEAELNAMYNKLFELQNNICACISLAHAVFYPLLVSERAPYLVLGNEPAQMSGLYYNRVGPKIAYLYRKYKIFSVLLNIGRLCLLKKPLRSGQREMLLLVKQLAYGDHFVKKIAGFRNQLISNVCESMDFIPNLKNTLKTAIKRSDRRAAMPSLIHIDMNEISENGVYDHEKIKGFLISECGYVAPERKTKSMHSSCSLEAAKDYSQFVSFYNMESQMIPFSALELIIASSKKNINREIALAELKFSFVLERPEVHVEMEKYAKR